jgi:anti-sigma factor (TIGR02949 family)
MTGCGDSAGCVKCDELLYAYQHGQLDELTQAEISEHLAACPECHAWWEEEVAIHERLKQCACEQAPENLRVQVMAFIATFRTTLR